MSPEISVPGVVQVSPQAIRDAAALLRAGHLVAFPTETVYGLGADATNARAVAAVFAAKGRPRFNPLIVHVHDLAAAARIARLDERALRIAEAFWPGALTLVLPLHAETTLCPLVTAGLETVALRIPAHPQALALLRATDRPVAAPSANPSGRISPTTAEHVAEGLGGRVAMILDAGPCSIGLESTILDLTGERPVLLRPGGTARERLEERLGPIKALGSTGDRPSAPGQLASHYAPRLPVRLDAETARPGEVLLGFGGTIGAVLDLSPTGDLEEAAANLFSMLHRLDAMQGPYHAIAVAPIPERGLGLAINDRLRRAAAPRP